MSFDTENRLAENPSDDGLKRGEAEAEAIPSSNGDGTPATALARRGPSDLKVAANRANGRKSRGPVTPEGKQRSSQNARRRSVRLLGLAEAQTLNQDPNAAERLYRDLISTFEPAPPLLARHFQDLARLYLELEAWERIRDAQLEHRWQQSDIERRRLFHEMERDLQGTTEEVYKGGLCRLEESAARSKRQAECLGLLKDHLARRDFEMGAILHLLYGKDLNPPSDRAQTICIRCQKLMSPQAGQALTESEFKYLLRLVDEEEQDAMAAHVLRLDEKTVTRAARLAGLGPNRQQDRWMSLQGERLRQAIDRKQWVISGLLRTLGLAQQDGPKSSSGAARRRRTGTEAPPTYALRNEPNKSRRINTSAQKQTENEPNRTQLSRQRRSRKAT